jgi:hypothetical protein
MLKFNYTNVKQCVVDALRTELDNNGYTKILVRKADAVEAGHIPCICVNRIDDSEAGQSLNDDEDPEFNETLQQWEEFKGTYFQESLEIRIWHTNADERDTLYILVKAILFSLRNSLFKLGVINIKLRGGKDEQDTALLAQPIYWASINMDYLNPLEISAIIQPTDDTAISQVDSTLTIINDIAEGSV